MVETNVGWVRFDGPLMYLEGEKALGLFEQVGLRVVQAGRRMMLGNDLSILLFVQAVLDNWVPPEGQSCQLRVKG